MLALDVPVDIRGVRATSRLLVIWLRSRQKFIVTVFFFQNYFKNWLLATTSNINIVHLLHMFDILRMQTIDMINKGGSGPFGTYI
jgi:hypothetical protein